MNQPLQSENQVLMTGCYRTGTEYLTQLLGTSPDLSATMYVVNYLRYSLDEYGDINERENLLSLLFDAAKRIRERWDRRLDVQSIIDRSIEQDAVTDGFLYDAMMSDLFLDGEASIWLEKNQLEWRNIPAFLEMFPDGKVIHVFRDPRSILASFREFTYTEPPAYLSAVFNTLDSMRKGLEYRETFAADRYHQIKYERLVRQRDEVLAEAFDFLNVSAPSEVTPTGTQATPDRQSWESNSAFSDAEPDSFDKEAAINRWKTHLEDWEVALSEAVNADVMSAYDYELSGADSADWRDFILPLLERTDLRRYLKHWLETGEGVEAFPTDPKAPDNWSENN